jgi:hypothetical protein
MRNRGAVLLVAVVAFASWSGVSGAEEDPATDTTVPATTVPATTLPPPTTVVEEPPPTTEPEAPLPAVEPQPEAETPGEGADTPRTLAVRPHTALVDRQDVVVRGRGWQPDNWVEAFQCRAGISGEEGCGRASEARTDARGNFRIETEVDTILETPRGTFDCRVAPCVIRAIHTRSDGGSRSVRLEFDPAGPDPVREEATISPDSDLVDGQVVTVVGDDFDASHPWGGYAELVECRLPVVDRGDCDDHTESYGDIASDGHVAVSYRLEGLLRIDGADVDCRTAECALFVGEEGGGLARAAVIPLDFDPAQPLGPPPTLTITPDEDLRDGQIVDVDAVGLRPKTYMVVLHCRWGAEDPEGCSLDDAYNFAPVRADGTLHFQTGLRAVFEDSHGRVNCRVTACALTVFDVGEYGYFAPDEGFGFGDLERVTRTRLHFLPHAPLLTPTIQTADLTGIRAGQRWRIHGTGARHDGVLVLMQCVAEARTRSGCAIGTRRSVYTYLRESGQVGLSWETRYRFKRFIHLANGRLVDCAAERCALVAVEQGADVARADRINTGFLA